ncbi:hypothetical protein ACFQ6N_12160 [Kitasatospora sp. NPDC056446]|uniref:hypothetical protein n=1 Tax=Kitasatospora sp. NPDC056446 TaxID=3345819 RepID=UPI0036880975
MNALRLLAAPAAALALTLGAAPAAPAAPATTTTTTATVLVVNDTIGPVQAHQGDTVQVELTAWRDYTVTWYWYAVGTTAPAVLTQTAGSADADGDAHGTFTAAAAGTSSITAIGRCVPDRGAVCPPWVINWNIPVTVS